LPTTSWLAAICKIEPNYAKEELNINKNSIYYKAVLKSTVIFKIKGTVVSLFNSWVANARQRYPEYSFQGKTEVLVNDLKVAFAKGLELVWRNENRTKRNIPGWSADVVLDTVSATLNTHWSQEYIYRQSPEYKELCFLKAVTQYLKVDTTALKKIDTLYKHIMSKEVHAIEQDSGKNENIIDLKQFRIHKKPDHIFKKTMIDYLESIFFEKHIIIFGDILKNKFTLELASFFSNDEIEQLVESVKRTAE
jgi:hypothetical protein